MTPGMMGRAEVRRSLLALGVHPRVVDSIVAELPCERTERTRGGAPSLRPDEAEQAAASVLADFERLLREDPRTPSRRNGEQARLAAQRGAKSRP